MSFVRLDADYMKGLFSAELPYEPVELFSHPRHRELFGFGKYGFAKWGEGGLSGGSPFARGLRCALVTGAAPLPSHASPTDKRTCRAGTGILHQAPMSRSLSRFWDRRCGEGVPIEKALSWQTPSTRRIVQDWPPDGFSAHRYPGRTG